MSLKNFNIPGFVVGFLAGLLVVLLYTSATSSSNDSRRLLRTDAGISPCPQSPNTKAKVDGDSKLFDFPFKYTNRPATTTPLPVSITELIAFTPLEAAATRVGGAETTSTHTFLSATRIASKNPAENGKIASASDHHYLASEDLYLHASANGCPAAMADAVAKAKAEGSCWKPKTPEDEESLVRLNPLNRNQVPGRSCDRTTPFVLVFDSYARGSAASAPFPRCTSTNTKETFTYGAYCLGSSSAQENRKALVTKIEPLCYPPDVAGATTVSRLYLTMDFPFATKEKPELPPAPLKRFLFDISSVSTWKSEGAETDATTPDSMHWFYNKFAEKGLGFTELSSWRPSWDAHPAPKFFEGTPGYLKPAYHYFNYPPRSEDNLPPTAPKAYAIGVSSIASEQNKDAVYTKSGNEGGVANDNPLNHIRLRCAPADFVVLKIHYTTPTAEVGNGAAGAGLAMTLQWLQTIEQDTKLQSLIDEIYVAVGSGSESSSPAVMTILQNLRGMGIRTHTWV